MYIICHGDSQHLHLLTLPHAQEEGAEEEGFEDEDWDSDDDALRQRTRLLQTLRKFDPYPFALNMSQCRGMLRQLDARNERHQQMLDSKLACVIREAWARDVVDARNIWLTQSKSSRKSGMVIHRLQPFLHGFLGKTWFLSFDSQQSATSLKRVLFYRNSTGLLMNAPTAVKTHWQIECRQATSLITARISTFSCQPIILFSCCLFSAKEKSEEITQTRVELNPESDEHFTMGP